MSSFSTKTYVFRHWVLHHVLGTLSQREGGRRSSLVHYSQDWLFLWWFLEDFCSWEYPSAAENTLTIILGGKQINRDGKHDDVRTYVIHHVSCVTSHPLREWMMRLTPLCLEKKHWASHPVLLYCHVPPQVLHLETLQAHQHMLSLWFKSFSTGCSQWHFTPLLLRHFQLLQVCSPLFLTRWLPS